ncbi:ABC transporter ATP-binding protein [Treponema sp.]|uniref:ABC transporter ATP-binding protein n=1 Tax=Treponema sp. TaxID=166 RepID=UPI00298D73A5|nr:ABC transporter ATP-binding protein [Treponema sp.]
MSDVVIRAENLSKYYNLGVINNGTLFRDIQTWWALKRGKEDPHSQIGSHKYDTTKEGFWALKDLNFEIKQGDRVGIIGKNGAGKSTLLKILSRITAPTEGKVKIKGRVASLLEVGTGFHAELTGRENIYLNGAILGMKRKEVDRKLDEIIAFSEIENHIDTPVKRYSSGMYVRLAFAVAAHLDSEILIADEVLAVGDAAFQKKALGKMNDLATGEGRTVLFVSHNMSQVKNLCTKGIVLEKGRVVHQDDNINDSINWYLGIGDGETVLTRGWKNDGSFYHKHFTPLEMSICDENDIPIDGMIPYDKGFKIKLKFNVDELDTIGCFWLELYKNTEHILTLENINYTFKKNTNHVCFEIQPRTFLPGTYRIALGSCLKNTLWIIDPKSNDMASFFTISNGNTYSFTSK